MKQLIECVPNISEGRDDEKIKIISQIVEEIDGIKLLNVDPGKATNRTVITFVGEPQQVIDAAFLLIQKAQELIDMSKHSGEHPRMGATDVCPLVPIANISMEETAKWAHKLGKRVGKELGIPVYHYEAAAKEEKRKNLANCRSGEYEGLSKKLVNPEWKPDFGPSEFNNSVEKSGATAISSRDFLVAYNVNLNTTSTRRANAVAFDIREAGRIKREGGKITGKIMKDADGNPLKTPGLFKSVKGIGWYIEEYGVAQISYNLTNINISPLHEVFDKTCERAQARGMRVTGSELVGLVPKKVLIDAGIHFLKKQERSIGIHESEIIKIAIKTLGLDELAPFKPKERIIEYMLENDKQKPLVNMTLTDFANETSSESPAPGGGSISAYCGAMGVALGTMVANLSAHKRGWDDRWEEFSDWAEKGIEYQNTLLSLVDEDTNAFNKIMDAFRMPKDSEKEKNERKLAIQEATEYAILTPYKVMETAYKSMEVMKAMAEFGNPNSVTDAGVGALCARTAVIGAFLNVKINCGDYENKAFVEDILSKGQKLVDLATALENSIVKITNSKI
ncbi:MAG: glutamate formimidoyltransferase [Flavobacteriales bacterium TMED123]|nr:MAG: glutamate formimidoyltransferase [Flavobacteriales bacterium TMED123]|tara:strand:- start:3697 stop:5388 length:1692 start_codon:yes stop_codon:yes gene_type:complete